MRGPSCVTNISLKKWFVTFIDDYTRLFSVYLLKENFEMEKTFKDFCAIVQNQVQAKIWVLRIENGKKVFFKYFGRLFFTKWNHSSINMF